MTPTRPTTLYNPHLLRKDELLAGFIARRPLLDALVDDLRRGGGQHHLLVGARGTGKTTLLLRLAFAIDDDPALAGRARSRSASPRSSTTWRGCRTSGSTASTPWSTPSSAAAPRPRPAPSTR
jgi:ABC-type molybdenum transport system ATPase subunit/photorepair protein PhrA